LAQVGRSFWSAMIALKPWDISWGEYGVCFVAFLVAKVVGDPAMAFGVRLATGGSRFAVMDNPKVRRLEKLETIDLVYLAMNMVVSFTYVSNLMHYAANSFSFEADTMTLLNTAPAFMALFLLYDLMYWAFHWGMHRPAVYAYVHKHHHRQVLPFRGILDAENEHPLEQVGGLSLLLLTVRLVHMVFGVHGFAFAAFFGGYSTFNVVNHLPYDLAVKFPVGYTAAAHQMHHRDPLCNFATCTMFWDKLFGTFKPYKDLPKEG